MNMYFIKCILCITLAAMLRVDGMKMLDSELYKAYFENGSSVMQRMPIEAGSTYAPLKILHSLYITEVYNIDMNEQTIDTYVLVSLQWKNPYVGWNRTKYGLQYLNLPPEKIWQPKLAIAESNVPIVLQATKTQGNAVLFFDGTVKVDFSYKIQISCKMSACLFPLDKQTCQLTLLLLSQNASEAVFADQGASNKDGFYQVPHDLWTVKVGDPVLSFDNVLRNPLNWKTSTAKRSFILERKPSYIHINIFIPVILVLIITISAIILPRDSGEKISLLITCFLSQIVYLDVLMSMFPKTSDYVPVMTVFTTTGLVFTAFQIAVTCMIAYLSKQVVDENTDSLLRRIYMRFSCNCRFFSKRNKNNVQPLERPDFGRDKNFGSTTEEIQEVEGIEKGHETQANTNEISADDGERKYRAMCALLCTLMEKFSVFVTILMLTIFPTVMELMVENIIPSFCK